MSKTLIPNLLVAIAIALGALFASPVEHTAYASCGRGYCNHLWERPPGFKFVNQSTGNNCGPAILEDWLHWEYVGTPVPGTDQDSLMEFMVTTEPTSIGSQSRELPLFRPTNDRLTQYGTGIHEVRRLNIAYDYGTDPHALAWTMWEKSPYQYHYVLYPDVQQATLRLLQSLDESDSPVAVAVQGGYHWVLVMGYDADQKAAGDYVGLGNYRIYFIDPLELNPVVMWRDKLDWQTYFTDYKRNDDPQGYPADPDVSNGGYALTNEYSSAHWIGKYVTIQSGYWEGRPTPDYPLDENGFFILTHPVKSWIGFEPSLNVLLTVGGDYRFRTWGKCDQHMNIDGVSYYPDIMMQYLLNGVVDAVLLPSTFQCTGFGTYYTCADVESYQFSIGANAKSIFMIKQASTSRTQHHTAKAAVANFFTWLIGVEGQGLLRQANLTPRCTAAMFTDVNLDGLTSVLDATSIGAYWGQDGPVPGWVRADTNSDTTISVLDLVSVGGYWGQFWDINKDDPSECNMRDSWASSYP